MTVNPMSIGYGPRARLLFDGDENQYKCAWLYSPVRGMSLRDMQISKSQKKFLAPLPNPGYAPAIVIDLIIILCIEITYIMYIYCVYINMSRAT